MATLNVNGQDYPLPADGNTLLLYVLRDDLGLTGTKFGCGMAHCGACTVHLEGKPVRACITSVAQAIGTRVTTIEGLATNGRLTPLQQAWIEHQVPQCGYCLLPVRAIDGGSRSAQGQPEPGGLTADR